MQAGTPFNWDRHRDALDALLRTRKSSGLPYPVLAVAGLEVTPEGALLATVQFARLRHDEQMMPQPQMMSAAQVARTTLGGRLDSILTTFFGAGNCVIEFLDQSLAIRVRRMGYTAGQLVGAGSQLALALETQATALYPLAPPNQSMPVRWVFWSYQAGRFYNPRIGGPDNPRAQVG
jgi:hypothetical protein